MAIFGVIRACNSNLGSVYLAIGKPRIIANLTLFYVIIAVPRLIALVPGHGAMGAALSVTVAVAIQAPVSVILLSSKIKLALSAVIGILWRPVLSALMMSWAVDMARNILFLPSTMELTWITAIGNYVPFMPSQDKIESLLAALRSLIYLPSVGVALQLPILIVTGASVYIIMILIFWWLSGKPTGSESAILKLIRSRFLKFR